MAATYCYSSVYICLHCGHMCVGGKINNIVKFSQNYDVLRVRSHLRPLNGFYHQFHSHRMRNEMSLDCLVCIQSRTATRFRSQFVFAFRNKLT